MDDLVQFVRDRLNEDERQARAAMTYAAADWFIETSGIVTTGPDGDAYTDDREVAEHIARHDPARVLADIEAKRYVIDQCAYWNERAEREAANPPKYPQPGLDIGLLLDAMNPILRGLALPYADHRDYREEWRP